jgi:hypothetical protein
MTTHGQHVANFSIPLPPDWPACPELRKMWPKTKADRCVAYYQKLITSSKYVSLGKCFVPGILYKNLPDATRAFIIDARYLNFEEEHVLQLVHSVDSKVVMSIISLLSGFVVSIFKTIQTLSMMD